MNLINMKSIRMIIRSWSILLLPLLLISSWIKARILKKYQVTVVTFHDVSVEEQYKFERIVTYLSKRFIFLTPSQFENYLLGKFDLQGPSLLVTFDDGFYSSLRVTKQVLEPLGIKAVFFCCSSFLGLDEASSQKFVANNLYFGSREPEQVAEAEFAMTVEDARGLAKSGHRIAGHTETHLDLGKDWPQDTLTAELKDSAVKLEQLVNQKIDWFAFPFGGIQYINDKSMKAIAKYYRLSFTGIRGDVGKNTNPMAIPRQSITIQDPYLLQLALFYGATNFMHRPKIEKIERMATNG